VKLFLLHRQQRSARTGSFKLKSLNPILKYEVVVEKIKRSLLLWRVPPSTTGKAILTAAWQIYALYQLLGVLT
jgi:hypothetical protein